MKRMYKIKDLLSERVILLAPMLEMTNLPPEDTGVKYVMWMGRIGGQHGPRIKVSNIKGTFSENNNFVVSIDHEPKVLTPRSVRISQSDVDDVTDWIKQNYSVLIELWTVFETGKGSVKTLISKLEHI